MEYAIIKLHELKKIILEYTGLLWDSDQIINYEHGCNITVARFTTFEIDEVPQDE